MRKGFTIIEMLVVILIIGIMVGVSIPYLNPRKWNLPTVEQMVKSKLRLVRQMSISKEGHYGVVFDDTLMIVFQDIYPYDNQYTTADKTIERLKLPEGFSLYAENTGTGAVVDNTNPIIFSARGVPLNNSSYRIDITAENRTVSIFVLVSGMIE